MPSLAYTLHRSARRTLSVEIHPNGTVHVRAPLRLADIRIEQFLQSRMPWVINRLYRVVIDHQAIPPLGPRQFHHRGRVMVWGTDRGVRVPTLRVDHADGPPTLVFPDSWPDSKHAIAVRQWQRNEAEHLFGMMIRETMPILGLESLRFRELRLRRMKRRWGSCSTGGVITLNERLIEVPDACIRAVVVHEMCHLVHMHHGPAFHGLVRQVLPNHQEADRLLDQWSGILTMRAATQDSSLVVAGESRRLPVPNRYADALAQISSNAAVSEDAIISGVRPSM